MECLLAGSDPRLLASIFTAERVKLWQLARAHAGRSISEIAAKAGRDVSRVRHDLRLLARYRLVALRRRGRRVEVEAAPRLLLVAVA